ncbi:MAG: hypothetical protein LLF89_04230, partial [Spirochaetaceae bacterium]|nr:hypothetical protein [Spirochaetaceae bacterium]
MGMTAMLNIELHVRAADSNSVLQHLEETGSFQVIYPDGAPPDSCNTLELALQKFAGQGEELHISGWVPADKAEVVSKAVVAGSAGRASIEIHSPEECRQEKGISSEDIPVLFRHGKFLSGFRPMVQSYATPCYGDIDPTPFAAFFFICFFSLMFGDLGQGAVIFCLGLAMRNAKKGF